MDRWRQMKGGSKCSCDVPCASACPIESRSSSCTSLLHSRSHISFICGGSICTPIANAASSVFTGSTPSIVVTSAKLSPSDLMRHSSAPTLFHTDHSSDLAVKMLSASGGLWSMNLMTMSELYTLTL